MVDSDPGVAEMLNIKNAETYRLARELADRTGADATAAEEVARLRVRR